MPTDQPLFTGAFPGGEEEEFSTEGKRPVIFDILAPDEVTSILPEGLRLVLHVNPRSMSIKYSRIVERIQTRGGWVEQHFGDGTQTIDFDHATGGFMRLFTGLSNITSPAVTEGTRRETLAYDSYLDLLALFHSNGSVYDEAGQVALQGIIKITFDEGIYLGWLNNLTVTEDATQPYQFTMSANFEVKTEVQTWRSVMSLSNNVDNGPLSQPETADAPSGDYPPEITIF